jgi:hypothetical protein
MPLMETPFEIQESNSVPPNQAFLIPTHLDLAVVDGKVKVLYWPTGPIAGREIRKVPRDLTEHERKMFAVINF